MTTVRCRQRKAVSAGSKHRRFRRFWRCFRAPASTTGHTNASTRKSEVRAHRAVSRNSGCRTPTPLRVPADRFKHGVESTGPIDDAAVQGHIGPNELGSEERSNPVDNLRVAIRMRNTAPHRRPVRGSSTNWRKLDPTACARIQPRGILESFIEYVPRPRRWPFPTTKPAKLRLFYSGDDTCPPPAEISTPSISQECTGSGLASHDRSM